MGYNERLLSWRIPLEKSRYPTIFGVYGPTLVSPEAHNDSSYDSLSAEFCQVSSADKIVPRGDFSARVGTK